MARTSLGPRTFVRDICSLCHRGLIVATGQEANGDDKGKSFRSSTQQWYVFVYSLESPR